MYCMIERYWTNRFTFIHTYIHISQHVYWYSDIHILKALVCISFISHSTVVNRRYPNTIVDITYFNISHLSHHRVSSYFFASQTQCAWLIDDYVYFAYMCSVGIEHRISHQRYKLDTVLPESTESRISSRIQVDLLWLTLMWIRYAIRVLQQQEVER